MHWARERRRAVCSAVSEERVVLPKSRSMERGERGVAMVSKIECQITTESDFCNLITTKSKLDNRMLGFGKGRAKSASKVK